MPISFAQGGRAAAVRRGHRAKRRGTGSRKRVVHGIQKTLFVEGLDQKIIGPVAHRVDGAVDRPVRGNDDDDGFGTDRQKFAHQIQPVAVGQHQVEQDNPRFDGPKGPQAVFGGAFAADGVTRPRRIDFIDELERGRVLDQKKRAAHAAIPARRARSSDEKDTSRSIWRRISSATARAPRRRGGARWRSRLRPDAEALRPRPRRPAQSGHGFRPGSRSGPTRAAQPTGVTCPLQVGNTSGPGVRCPRLRPRCRGV